MSTYSIKMPDMSRNMALAGKTVSTRGMNVTYDENGYAVKAVNYSQRTFAETSKSICAPSKEAVLAAGTRTGYDGPDEDRLHFTDHEFARAIDLRRQVAEGKLSEGEANDQIEEIRRMYGYSYGTSGSQYAKIELPDERPDEVAKARLKSSVAAQNTSVQSAATQDDPGETEQLQNSYQVQLREQQQRQTMQSELEDLRVWDLIRVDGKEKTADALLEMMEREDDD